MLVPEAPHGVWGFTEWFDDSMDRAATLFARHLARTAEHEEQNNEGK